MTGSNAGWYEDSSGRRQWWDGERWTDGVEPAAPHTEPGPAPSGMNYVVLQISLKERMWGSGSGNLPELEKAINDQAALGYRLHTMTAAAVGSNGMRVQVTLVFEKIT